LDPPVLFEDNKFLIDEIDIDKVKMVKGKEDFIISTINSAISHSHL